ncbi:hypothetical protein LptCag_1539 [Leptospirillum ferriphilum]|uniref:Uncharacterized protein n=1 Tax=Leptospirillum ferriphilum TaxID=178606 RepID=A0A094X5J9_9BACT|nr:hypothetical protein [Leptospirillum ferriphilum]KGA93829.1 hypothetical protein LptCag_1539 [Leptospirillum ferriphilum]
MRLLLVRAHPESSIFRSYIEKADGTLVISSFFGEFSNTLPHWKTDARYAGLSLKRLSMDVYELCLPSESDNTPFRERKNNG